MYVNLSPAEADLLLKIHAAQSLNTSDPYSLLSNALFTAAQQMAAQFLESKHLITSARPQGHIVTYYTLKKQTQLQRLAIRDTLEHMQRSTEALRAILEYSRSEQEPS